MDKQLNELISLATLRGTQYIKGETSITELPEKLAELSVFLLIEVPRVAVLKGDKLREEFNEIQQKIDDFRKAIFVNKLNSK